MTLLFYISVEGSELPSQISPLLPLKKQYLETESRIGVTEHWEGGRKGELLLTRLSGFLFGIMKIILEINSGGCTTVWMYLMLLYTRKWCKWQIYITYALSQFFKFFFKGKSNIVSDKEERGRKSVLEEVTLDLRFKEWIGVSWIEKACLANGSTCKGPEVQECVSI